MKNKLIVVGAGAIVAFLAVACIVATLKIDLAPKKAAAAKKPVRTHNLGEGIRVTQHGLYGVDLVTIARAHMRKLRKGPFTIGAINELVLEDVALTLPEALWKEKAEVGGGQGNGQPQTAKPQAMLAKLGINAGNLKMGGKMPRFSALSMRNLRVSRLDGTNAVPWFAAARAEAERGGLKLEGGWTFAHGVTNAWAEAVLAVEPKLELMVLR